MAALVMAAEAALVMVAELRLGQRVVRNYVLGQCRLHWKLLAM